MSPSVRSFVVSVAKTLPAPTGGGSRSLKVQRPANLANSETPTQPFLTCSVEAQPDSVQPSTPPKQKSVLLGLRGSGGGRNCYKRAAVSLTKC